MAIMDLKLSTTWVVYSSTTKPVQGNMLPITDVIDDSPSAITQARRFVQERSLQPVDFIIK